MELYVLYTDLQQRQMPGIFDSIIQIEEMLKDKMLSTM